MLASDKNNTYYLEYCKVRVENHNLVFEDTTKSQHRVFNIPYHTTAILMLGPGTSLTQQAARLCAEKNILVTFCSGDNLGYYLTSTNEYRPTEFMRSYMTWYFETEKQLNAAKFLLKSRIETMHFFYKKYYPFLIDNDFITYTSEFLMDIETCNNKQQLLLSEARLAKKNYAHLSKHFKVPFVRQPGSGIDSINTMIDNANYMMYAQAAFVLHTMGISFSCAVLHGETRRGALVFDIADVFKDAISLPLCFSLASQHAQIKNVREELSNRLIDIKFFEMQFDITKKMVYLY